MRPDTRQRALAGEWCQQHDRGAFPKSVATLPARALPLRAGAFCEGDMSVILGASALVSAAWAWAGYWLERAKRDWEQRHGRKADAE
jgi:hypothetical protein